MVAIDNEEFMEVMEISREELHEDIVNFYEIEEEPSFIQKFFSFFKNKETTVTEIYNNDSNSEFSEYLDDIDEDEEGYLGVLETTMLCGESLDIAKRKINFLNRLKENDIFLDEISTLDHISDDDLKYLKKLCERYELLARDNTSLMIQVTSYSGNVSSLEGITQKASDVLPSIKKAERKKSLLEQDIAIIESERYSLYSHFDLMNNALKLVNWFAYGVIFISIFCAFCLAYMQVFHNVSVFYPIIVLVVVLLCFITFVYIFRVKTTREIKRNNIKQGKLIALQNKKTAVLANTENYLKYTYKKYKINSSSELDENLHEFNRLKNTRERKNAARRALIETEEEIKDFFVDMDLQLPDAPLESVYSIIQMEDRDDKRNRIAKEQSRINKELEVLDEKQENIWGKIVYLKENDTSDKKIIGEIIKAYYHKTDKLMS